MRRAARHRGAIVKSAVLWLTIGVMLASVYGALVATGSERPQLLFAASEPESVLVAGGEFDTASADR